MDPDFIGAPEEIRTPDPQIRSLVLSIDPVRRAPGAIRLIAPFGDDALQSHGARVLEHEIAVGADQMLGQPDAVAGLP